MKKIYKINITITEKNREINSQILANKTFNGFFFQELITQKTFYPIYRYPASIKECMHNGEYIDGIDEINRQIKTNGYSMIMFIEENEKIEEITDENIIQDYYKNFHLSNFNKYISKEIQKKKLKGRK